MQQTPPSWHTHGLHDLLAQRPLDPGHVRAFLHDLLNTPFDEAHATAFLTALRMRGEHPADIATAVEVLRGPMVRLPNQRRPVLDTCGTGGDGSGTFNISTAVALVVAACGVDVVKHGNRSVSSRSGSADVLAQLGVPFDRGVAWATQSFHDHGFAFCFAPQFHPALAKVGPLRRKLGFRTIFNLLGPLLNPANAEYQLLGVGHPSLLDPMAHALAILGTQRAFVVCGADGLDEVTLAGVTMVREVTGHEVKAHEWTPAEFGLEAVSLPSIAADGPETSAAIIRAVLAGEDGPARRIVLANAAAGLWAVGRVGRLPEGVQQAAIALDSGKAAQLLQALVAA